MINVLKLRLSNLEYIRDKGGNLRDFAIELEQIRAPLSRAYNECMDCMINKDDLNKIFKNIGKK